MQRLFTLSIIALAVCLMGSFSAFSKTGSDQTKGNQDIASNDAGMYLYGAVIESATGQDTPQDNGGLLSKDVKKRIRIINLGPIVNYSGVDYAPTISADGKTLYFVSDRPGSKLTADDNNSHDFWAAKKNDRLDTVFFKPFNIDTTNNLGNQGVNTALNEGAASIAADKQSLYFTGCNRPDGLGDCDLYKTVIEGDKWGRPTNLGKNVNSKWWDSQPSIAPDQSRIYFVSNRPGPHGDDNIDIWYSDYDSETEEWKPAQNLSAVNTDGEEESPFIAADNSTLFFASDGWKPNYGGLDFYVTRHDEATGKWSTPENLGEPINTSEREQFITLPASGDIIYFSSTRDDLKGYQGNLDIFMAFVPTFFKAINVKVTVIDECSGENIPAVVTIKNPITGRTENGNLTTSQTEFQMIVANTDYGNPKDSLKFVDLDIQAENPKYGKTGKIQRVNRPSVTIKSEEAGKVEDEINVVLTLGQRPVLDKQVDEAEHVRQFKAEKPELANYNGLVMKQVVKWDLYPLLNYVFFDLGSSEMSSRYNLFSSPEETANFTDTTIAGGTLDKYYHILNIYGFRLNEFPEAKIEIVGCNDGTSADEKKPGLSKERAEKVYNYFKNVWKIPESRMKLTVRNLPATVSNLKDSLGIVENRRVEILCSDWNIMKPIFDKDPKTLPQPETMNYKLKNGIEDELVAARRIEITRNGQPWKVLNDVGITDETKKWDWTNTSEEYPKDEVPFTAQLVVTTKGGKECKSDPINIPVMQVRMMDQMVKRQGDSTWETYNLILFPFDSPNAGPINERIMKEYVYSRCQPTSSIEVVGHTDVVGLYDHNQALSEKRATTVFNGISQTTKSKFGKLDKRGVGEDSPLYDNTLPEGRFYNRTTQVVIHTPLKDEDTTQQSTK